MMEHGKELSKEKMVRRMAHWAVNGIDGTPSDAIYCDYVEDLKAAHRRSLRRLDANVLEKEYTYARERARSYYVKSGLTSTDVDDELEIPATR